MSKLLNPLTKQEEDIVLSEVGYSREQLEKDVEYLREWLEQQKHLPSSCLKEKDEFLQMFLTGSKGSLETAKRKLDNYYTYRAESELLHNRDPLQNGYTEVTDMSYIGVLPQVSNKTIRIGYICLRDPDPEKFDFALHLKRFINILEIKLREEGISCGHYIIMDNKCGTNGHIFRANPCLVRDLIRLIQDFLPFRISGVFFINSPPFIETFFNKLVIPFLSKKLQQRIHVSSKGPEILSEYLPKSLIPEDYGGENISLKELSATWRHYELEKREWFLNELSENTDESKRINLNDKKSTDHLFGVHGSLKKLVID